jgi:hypothetical protein
MDLGPQVTGLNHPREKYSMQCWKPDWTRMSQNGLRYLSKPSIFITMRQSRLSAGEYSRWLGQRCAIERHRTATILVPTGSHTVLFFLTCPSLH